MKKILVVTPNWLGDVVFSTPVFKAIRQHNPEAHIACLAAPRVLGLLNYCPDINEIIAFDDKGTHQSILGKLKLICFLKSKQFNIAYLLQGSTTRSLLMALAQIPIRVGYQKSSKTFLTYAINKECDRYMHRRDVYLNVIENHGINVSDRTTSLVVPADQKEKIKSVLIKRGLLKKPLVVLNTGGNWDLKQWSAQSFADLAHRLIKELGVDVLIPGSQKDREKVDAIIQSSDEKIVNFCGETSLSGLMALMAHADVVVSADSGPLHIANSVGANVVALFGPTRPENTGPCGLGGQTILQHDVGCNKSACYYLSCPENVCMKSININQVYDAVKKFLNQ